MNITTTITDYLGFSTGYYYYDIGRSFVTKSQSGYYFPCRYAFYNDDSSVPEIHFVKGIAYNPSNQVGCTKVTIATEEPNFDFDLLNDYDYPTAPFYVWRYNPHNVE